MLTGRAKRDLASVSPTSRWCDQDRSALTILVDIVSTARPVPSARGKMPRNVKEFQEFGFFDAILGRHTEADVEAGLVVEFKWLLAPMPVAGGA
jgi:hypothetical protein